MVEAAREYKRMVQVGSQQPQHAAQDPRGAAAAKGAIGKVYHVQGFASSGALSIGH